MPTALPGNGSSFAAYMEVIPVTDIYSAQKLARLWWEQNRYGSGMRVRASKFGCCGGMQSRAQKGRSHVAPVSHLATYNCFSVYRLEIRYGLVDAQLQIQIVLDFKCNRQTKLGFQMMDINSQLIPVMDSFIQLNIS
jgi:hypothetical protein